MESSAKKDYAAQQSGGEDLPAESQDVAADTSTKSIPARQSRYQYHPPTADDLQRVLDAAHQGGDHLSFSTVAWDLGHALIDQQDYAPAAKCFQRMQRSAARVDDQLLNELARVAQDLCTVLSGEQSVGKELLLAHKRLNQSLFQISDEDLSFARDVLEAYAEARSTSVRHSPPTPLVNPSVRKAENGASPPAAVSGHRDPAANHQEDSVRASVSAQPHLEARFFGRFEVLYRGKTVPLGHNSKALAILKYLLAHKPQPVSQDYLMTWLWSESSPKRARWSLNSAICALRKLLSSGVPSVTPCNCVLLEAGYYRLSPEIRVSSDMEDFDAHYKRGRRLEKARQMPEAAAEYEKAIKLYRGDFLVEDLYEEWRYEDWTEIERERLANVYMDALSRLAGYYMDTGQLRESIRVCYQLLEKDSCREDSYRLLMRCYTHLGLRAQALAKYQLCEEILERRYGIAPSPETQALYQDLLKGESI